MKINFVDHINPLETLVVLTSEDKLSSLIAFPIKIHNFQGKIKEVLDLKSFSDYKRVIIVGLGSEKKLEDKLFMNIGGFLSDLVAKDNIVQLKLYTDYDNKKAISQIILGMKLKSWSFDKYISKEEDKKTHQIKELYLIDKDENIDLTHINSLVQGVNFARELINEPSNVLYPQSYVDKILKLKHFGITVEVLDKKQLEKNEMHSLLSVAWGSDKEPYVVVMHYKGNPNSADTLAFVGKGVTFDTGGYSIKPADGMIGMKKDMTGSAVVVGLLKTLALRGAKVNAVGVIGLVENTISPAALKPGDIVKAMNGKTIEVLNTDAEGRLVLADILWYAQDRYKPKIMVNLATLTGAMIVALGGERAGLFSNNDKLAKNIFTAGEKTGELVWQLPMGEEYEKHMKSSVADLQNIGVGMKGAGSIFAAVFLKEFVNSIPWAHLDIAGVSSNIAPTDIDRKGCVAFGVRLLDKMIADNYDE